MMSDKDNNLLKSDILTVGSELSEKLNAIGIPNTFGKASEGKDNLMSIIRMTISGFDMIIEKIREILRDYYNKSEVNTLLNGKSDTSHNHDTAYANISHNHDTAYANISHNHDSAYASKNHNHDTAYANISHNHDSAYASKSHQHDGADVILSNNNNVDTEIGNIENNITSINGDITSLMNGKSDISHNHDSAYASKSHQHDGADVILSNSNDVGTEIGNIENDITSINGNITSLNNSIANLVQIQSVWFDFGKLTVNSSSTRTKTVKARPDGMNSAVIPRIQNFCSIQSASINGTDFTLTAINQSSDTHNCNATVLLVYFPNSWSI